MIQMGSFLFLKSTNLKHHMTEHMISKHPYVAYQQSRNGINATANTRRKGKGRKSEEGSSKGKFDSKCYLHQKNTLANQNQKTNQITQLSHHQMFLQLNMVWTVTPHSQKMKTKAMEPLTCLMRLLNNLILTNSVKL